MGQSPVRDVVVDTDDVEHASHILRRRYADHAPRLSGRSEDFTFRLRARSAGSVGTEQLEHSMDLASDVAGWGVYFVVYCRGGRTEFTNRWSAARLGPGDAVLTAPDVPHGTRWSDLKVGALRLDRGLVDTMMTEIVGADLRARDLDLSTPRSPAGLVRWRSEVRGLTQDLFNRAALAPLAKTEIERRIVATTLTTFVRPQGDTDAERTGTATLRRAISFIEAHADRPLTVSDIADAARVTPRALQLAFRRHRQTTPMGYLRQVRLSAAHGELAAPTDDATTVGGVAARWGFAHAGRFAALYRSTYGVAPTETLRAAHLT